MKKAFFVLPLSILLLTACSSSSNTPPTVVNAGESDLPPSMMQPVPGTGAMDNSYGWQTEVQPVTMPSMMQTPPPSYTPPAVPTPTPRYTPPAVPTPAPSLRPAPVSPEVHIPRDANNAPIYSQMNKGFYQQPTYTVRPGDTMFLISYITGKSVSEIAAMNNMSEPYQLHVGKVLTVNRAAPRPHEVVAPTTPSPAPITYTSAPNGTAFGSDGTVTGPVRAGVATAPSYATTTVNRPRVIETVVAHQGARPVSTSPHINTRWQWPADGQVITRFSGSNPGIEIAGRKGQPVRAAADGRVAHIGNNIEGYGNMIIIHHGNFMSAYGHNDTLRVKANDQVKAGQQIATLGNSGSGRYSLHFEIRDMNNKNLDPLNFLPKR